MQRRHRYGGLCGAVLALAMATACRHRGPPTDIPPRYAGPLRSRDIERGGHIYQTFCVPCHAGRVNPNGYRWSPAQMRNQIREGSQFMPAIRPEFISSEDLEAVLAFLTVIDAVEAPLPEGDEQLASLWPQLDLEQEGPVLDPWTSQGGSAAPAAEPDPGETSQDADSPALEPQPTSAGRLLDAP